MRQSTVIVAAALVVGLIGAAARAQLTVSATSPAINAAGVSRSAPISVTFDRAVDPATFTALNFSAFGKWTGPVNGPIALSNADRTVTLIPTRPLAAGEQVMLVMSRNLRGADGSPLRNSGYTLTFSTAVDPTPGQVFRDRARLYTRGPNGAGPQTRIYGGLACDLNLDGMSDLTIINEVSADIRVFMNRNDGSGLFETSFLAPPTDIPFESSPNEPADFNRDGFVDVVTSSFQENRIAVVFGNGDGTFDPAVEIPVGGQPRGFGIIDLDGDGDLDITVAQAGSDNIAKLINNGAGVFSAPVTFEGGVGDEYGLCAADMNADGLLDLVVGGIGTQTVRVLINNGDTTFTPAGIERPVSGGPWVVVCADVNGDGRVDVTTANSFGATGSVLLGNGDGTLQPAVNRSTSGHTVATDLADFDGDGDADWILSSFGGGRWHMYLNNGAGAFTDYRTIIAPSNPACCLPADFDRDGDIDLAFIDEIADIIVLHYNVCPADVNFVGGVSVQDIFDFLAAYFADQPVGDFNGTGGITVQDIFDFLAAYFSAC